MINVQRLASIRKRVIDKFGVAGVHALEDGLTVGVVVGLSITYYQAAILLLAVLVGSTKRAGPVAILSELPQLVREDARRQESYLVVSFVVGTLAGLALGGVLASVGVLQNVSLPF